MAGMKRVFRFDILTIFPRIIDAYVGESILKRAQEKGVAKITAHDLRNFTTDKHRATDDTPYGGGAGMVMKAEPILKCAAEVLKKGKVAPRRRRLLIMSAKGQPFSQELAYSYAKKCDQLVLVCGRYEGIDERVKTILKAEEISIGPYVTTDGDVAAMAIISAVARLLPGVISWDSLAEESHWDAVLRAERETGDDKLLEYPHYTRPEVVVWKGKRYRVPSVLLSGNHRDIAKWRAAQRKASRP
jgi:tRNA (guanine37-N1)-methyltransferase